MPSRSPRDVTTVSRLCLALALATACIPRPAHADDAAERRIGRLTQYLAADELEGRGLQTEGIHVAAERIAAEFLELGLQTAVFSGSPFQEFEVTTAAELGDVNRLTFRVPPTAGIPPRPGLELGDDFNPLAIGGSGDFELPVAFVGYGISADSANYDDYEAIDVEGKAVIVLRHEPQQDNPHSAFDGTDSSNHATFRRKVSNAYQHGAKAIIFVTDKPEIDRRIEQVERRRERAIEELAKLYQSEMSSDDEETGIAADHNEQWQEQILKVSRAIARYHLRISSEQDPVLGFTDAGRGGERRDLPVLHVRREVIDGLLAAAGKPPLAEIEAGIDQQLQPQSFDLPGVMAEGQITIERQTVTTKNVAAVLPGKGPHAEEVIVIGAHYDHLGRGEEGSAANGSKDIHNGADDNASGVATLLEIARILADRETPPARTIVFVAFSGEERGLLGSGEYANDPPYPLEQTVAMLNLDMVGRMKNEELIVNGSGTATEFDSWIDELNTRHNFSISKSEGGFGPSDHSTFYAKEIPVLHFFTGLHEDYHKPTDDFELVNIIGMRRIAEYVAEMAERIAAAAERPTYAATGRDRQTVQASGDRPYLGSIPAFPQRGDGYELSGVAKEGPAALAGIRAGDKIIQFGDFKIANLEDIDSALRKFKGGDRVQVIVRRGDAEIPLQLTLDPPR